MGRMGNTSSLLLRAMGQECPSLGSHRQQLWITEGDGDMADTRGQSSINSQDIEMGTRLACERREQIYKRSHGFQLYFLFECSL